MRVFVQSSKNGAGIPTDCYRQLKIIIGGQRSEPSPRSMRISSSAGNTGPIWPRPLAFRCAVSYTYPGFLRHGGPFLWGKATFLWNAGDVFPNQKKRIAARKKGKLLRKKRVVGRFFEQKPFELGWIGTCFFWGCTFFCRFLEDFLVRILPNKALVVKCIRGSKWMCHPGFEAI